MGYETRLIVIKEGADKKVGYQSVEATLEMGKIAQDKVGELISKLSEEANKKAKELDLHKLIKEYKAGEKELFDAEGNYKEEFKNLPELEIDSLYEKKISKPRKKLDKNFPYIYADGNNRSYTDDYGDALMITDVETILDAIKRDNALMIQKGTYESADGYRRFVIAINLLEGFREKNGMFNNVKVILWGH